MAVEKGKEGRMKERERGGDSEYVLVVLYKK